MSRKSALSQNFHELVRRLEGRDRRRQVVVGGVVARDELCRSAGARTGNTRDSRRERAGAVGIANSRIARRPPGRSTRCISRQAASGLFDVANAERDRDGIDRLSRDAESASRRRARARSSCRAAHASVSRGRRAAWRPRSRRRRRERLAEWPCGLRSRGPPSRCTESSTRSLPVKLERADRALSPRPVDPGAQDVVEEVVPAGNGIEHAFDASGRLVGRAGHTFPVQGGYRS